MTEHHPQPTHHPPAGAHPPEHGHDHHHGPSESFKKFQEMDQIVDDTIETLHLNHHRHYIEAADAVLGKDAHGNYNFKKLEDDGAKKQFFEKLSDSFWKGAMDYMVGSRNVDVKNPLYKSVLFSNYGVDIKTLEKVTTEKGSKLGYEAHKEISDAGISNLSNQLSSIALGELKDGDDEHLKHEVGEHDWFDPSKADRNVLFQFYKMKKRNNGFLDKVMANNVAKRYQEIGKPTEWYIPKPKEDPHGHAAEGAHPPAHH